MDQTEEYIRRVLKVLIFIDENIEEEMTIEQLAKIACYSPYHFHRIFQAVVGETLHRYVKRLRMEKAASKLIYSADPVTEIALDACYETPSAFTKAFKQLMGKSPKDYREINSVVVAIAQKIKDLPMIKPDKIENNVPELELLFIRRSGSYMKSPWEAWQAMEAFIDASRLDRKKLRFFGIANDNPQITNEEKLRFDACITAPPGLKVQGEVGRQVIKGGKYAIFTHTGPYQDLTSTIENIFLKWFPASKEILDEDRKDYLEYLNKELVDTAPEKLITKIFIPLV